jgi:3-oxoadipate enol-lactonase
MSAPSPPSPASPSPASPSSGSLLSGRVTVRGVELAHDLAGPRLAPGTATPAIPLVWGHGLTSSRALEDAARLVDWDRVRHSTPVLRYDARGHGLSASTDDLDGYHWRALAHDQLALADAVGIGTYVAGGASMGAATALHAAVLAPGRVRGLVLVIPPTAWDTRAAQAAGYELTAELVEAGRIDVLVEGMRTLPVADPLDPDEVRARSEAGLRTADPVRLARVLRGAARADLPPPAELATLDVPALVLAWTGDAGHPISTAERLLDLLPHARLDIASTAAQLATWTDQVTAFVAEVG